MNRLPPNKWTAAALIWLIAGIYALVLRESSAHQAPPFAHFDKIMHALLFFAQFWLAAKAFIAAQRGIPLKILFVLACVYGAATEIAQACFTRTRQGDILDWLVDLAGAAAALYLAQKVQAARIQTQAEQTK